MKKFNYNEPEFKVVISAAEDVITTSLVVASDEWDTNKNNGTISTDNLFSI